MDIPELFISSFFLSLDGHEQETLKAMKSQANSLAIIHINHGEAFLIIHHVMKVSRLIRPYLSAILPSCSPTPHDRSVRHLHMWCSWRRNVADRVRPKACM